MASLNPTPFPVIGISPGNSYFKDEEVKFLLETIVTRYGRAGVLIADIPATSTYVAMGYSENRARRDKAIPKGNALKNKVRRIANDLSFPEETIRIVDWAKEVADNPNYMAQYARIKQLYIMNCVFQEAVNATTREVLVNTNKSIQDIPKAVDIAKHYLLSELAALEFLPSFFNVERISYVYHKNWPVYEDYIAGRFDGQKRYHLDFLLVENPYETYKPFCASWENDNLHVFHSVLERVEKTRILRVGLFPYLHACFKDSERDEYRGVFYDVLVLIAQMHGWKMTLSEETGYGVIVDGLNEGRFDIFGSTVWPTPERKASATFSTSLYESPVHIWTRKGQDTTSKAIREGTALRIAIKENDITDSIARADFPFHRVVRVPQLAPDVEVLRFVAEGRADLTFAEPDLVEKFNQSSLCLLEPVIGPPIRRYGNCFMMRHGEERFAAFINQEIQSLAQQGTLAAFLAKYR